VQPELRYSIRWDGRFRRRQALTVIEAENGGLRMARVRGGASADHL
jgi:hypothetical protein